MKKFKFYLNDEAEERWVNEMSRQGWQLTKFSPFVYTFEREGTVYTYRNEMITQQKNRFEYFAFLEETGVEIVHANPFWAYYRKAGTEENFELFTDTVSTRTYLQKKLQTYWITLLFLLISMLSLFLIPNIGQEMTHPVTASVTIGFAFLEVLLIVAILSIIYRTKKHLRSL